MKKKSNLIALEKRMILCCYLSGASFALGLTIFPYKNILVMVGLFLFLVAFVFAAAMIKKGQEENPGSLEGVEKENCYESNI